MLAPPVLPPMHASLLLLLLAGAPLHADTACPVEGGGEGGARPKVGLALGGGSARGLAHIGVLQVLEEKGIPIDFVAGTSMGAIVGALYASGRSPAQVEQVAREIDWASVFSGRGDRRLEAVAWRVDDVPNVLSLGVSKGRLLAPAAAYSDYRISKTLTRYLTGAGVRAGGDFDRLSVPFRAVATDLATGERVVLARGDLPRAVRASMSQPVFFPPTEFEGRTLVDGGLVDNVPGGVARDMGADVVIAIDVGAPPTEIGEDADVLTVVRRMTDFMMASGNRSFAQPPDVRIRPQVEGVESGDYDRFGEIIERGRAAARLALAEIEPLLCGRRGTPRSDSPSATGGPEGRLERVEFRGLKRVSEKVVRRRLRLEAGQAFDLQAAELRLDAVWASNLFSSAWMEVKPGQEGGLDLLVSVRERPNLRASVGLSYQESDNLRGTLRLRNGNLLGLGERLDARFVVDSGRAEFEAFLGNANLAGSLFGYRLGVRVAEDKPLVYEDGGVQLGRTRFRQFRLNAAGSRTLGRDALVEAGLVGGRSEVVERAGIPYPAETDTVAKVAGRLVLDTLDNRFWASRGFRLDGKAEQSLTSLGATLSYWRSSFRADAFRRLGGRWILEAHAFGGAGQDDRVPVYDLHRIGGPVLVPGQSRDSLWGTWAAAASLGLTLRPSSRWQMTLRGGAGQAWPNGQSIRFDSLRAGGSLGIARFTPVGPVSLELGFGGGGVKVYVALGFQ